MADKVVSDQEFFLMSDFITNEIILDKENLYTDKHTESLSYFSNNNFLVPPFSAAPKAPETQKAWPVASSTQSVLSPVVGTGGSLVPSPPITPIGQNIQGQNRNYTSVNPSVHNGTGWGGELAGTGGYDVTPGMAWSGSHAQYQRRSEGGFDVLTVGYGGGIKKERAGTGVFLPRIQQDTTPVSRKKTGGSTSQDPKRVVQAQNKKIENANPRHSVGSSSHISENEPVMAGRDGALARERRKYETMTASTSNPVATSGEEVNDELGLPQEWTY